MSAAEQVVSFRLERNVYALRLGSVAGIGEPETMREIQGAPGPALGLSEWRGRLLTVLDLARLVGEPAPEGRPCLVRLTPPLESIALYICGPVRLARIAPPPPDPAAGPLQALGRDGLKPLFLIDPERLVACAGSAPEG